jgi:hypothetical protein
MIINYTFFSQVAHYLFFTSFGKKIPQRSKQESKKAKMVALKCEKTLSINTKPKNPQQQKQA